MENAINKLISGFGLEEGLSSIETFQKGLSLLSDKDYKGVEVVIEGMATKQIKSRRFGIDAGIMSSLLHIDRSFNEILEEKEKQEALSANSLIDE